MITTVELSLPLQEQLRAEALRAYPRECCGLIEGVLSLSLSKGEAGISQIAHIAALHPVPNVAKQDDRFEIDPAAHIALLRNLRGTGHDVIGCYHSHPNGRAEPSDRDRESAEEDGFLWLITAVDSNTRAGSTAAFVCAVRDFSQVAIVHDISGTAGVPPASPKANGVTEVGAARTGSLDPPAEPLL